MPKFHERLKSRSIAKIFCCLIFVGIIGDASDLSAQRAGARRSSRNRASQNAPQRTSSNAYYLQNPSFRNPAADPAPSVSIEADDFLKNDEPGAVSSGQKSGVPTAVESAPDLALADADFLAPERNVSTAENDSPRRNDATRRHPSDSVDSTVQALAESLSVTEDSASKTFQSEQITETRLQNLDAHENLTRENGKNPEFPTRNSRSSAPNFSQTPRQADSPSPSSRETQAPEQAKCFWFTNWNEARAAVIETGRPLLIHFSAPYCGPCRRMEETVFTKETVQGLTGAYFAAVKVDGSKSAKLCAFFKVSQFPTDIIVAPSGDVLARHTGFQNADQYCSFLTLAAAKVNLPAMTTPIGPEWRTTAERLTAPALRQAAPTAADSELVSRRKNSSVAATKASNSQNPPRSQSGYPEETLLEPPAVNLSLNENRGENQGNQFDGTQKSEDDEVLDLLSLPVKKQTETSQVAGRLGENEELQELLALETREQAQEKVPDLDESQMHVEDLDSPSRDWELAEEKTSKSNQDSRETYLHRASYSSENSGSPVSADPIPTLMDGFCPVAMVEQNAWVPGNAQLSLLYGNGRYYFENEESKEKFARNPAFYALVSDGMDVVLLTDQNQKAPGTRRLGIRYANLNFVFATEESQQKFRQNPDFYLKYAQEQTANESKSALR